MVVNQCGSTCSGHCKDDQELSGENMATVFLTDSFAI